VGYPACITKREQADENNAESSSGQTRNEFSRPGVGGENMGNSDGERFVAIRSGTIETKGLPTCSGIRGPNINTGSDLESGRRQFAGVGRAMAYAIGAGLEKRQTVERRCNVNRWPGRPGEPQYEWEAPRTVESGMGCTIDGYNFREDILRALGNGVVEDTAEIAFIDLLNKHFS
jgi:DNA (cytosine-5)-methyltransferase 1